MNVRTVFAFVTLAAALPLAAQDRFNDRFGDRFNDRFEARFEDRCDLHHDYARAARLRADLARDRYRLNQDLRFGHPYAAANEARDIAHDSRALDAQRRDIHHDWHER